MTETRTYTCDLCGATSDAMAHGWLLVEVTVNQFFSHDYFHVCPNHDFPEGKPSQEKAWAHGVLKRIWHKVKRPGKLRG